VKKIEPKAQPDPSLSNGENHPQIWGILLARGETWLADSTTGIVAKRVVNTLE
jgi:hypothetical protein